LLELIGPVQAHGIQNKALISFATHFNGSVWSSPSVGYLSNPNYAGFRIAGWFPTSEFNYYYDIVRSERPVHVIYELRESGSATGYLSKLGLGTGAEVIGEGPSDSTQMLEEMLAKTWSDVGARVLPMPTVDDLAGVEAVEENVG
jgi:hypothetical protein